MKPNLGRPQPGNSPYGALSGRCRPKCRKGEKGEKVKGDKGQKIKDEEVKGDKCEQ